MSSRGSDVLLDNGGVGCGCTVGSLPRKPPAINDTMLSCFRVQTRGANEDADAIARRKPDYHTVETGTDVREELLSRPSRGGPDGATLVSGISEGEGCQKLKVTESLVIQRRRVWMQVNLAAQELTRNATRSPEPLLPVPRFLSGYISEPHDQGFRS